MLEPKKSNCRSCGAEIYFAVTVHGKVMPVDAEPVADGGLVLDVNKLSGEVKVSAYAPSLGARRRFISHFVKCAQAAEHRKPKT